MSRPPGLGTLPAEILLYVIEHLRRDTIEVDTNGSSGYEAQAAATGLQSLRLVSRRLCALVRREQDPYCCVDLTAPRALAFFFTLRADPVRARRIRAVGLSTLVDARPTATMIQWARCLGTGQDPAQHSDQLWAAASRLSAPHQEREESGREQAVASEMDPRIAPWQIRIETLLLLAFRSFPLLETLRLACDGGVSDQLLGRVLAECPQLFLRTLHFNTPTGRTWAGIDLRRFWALWRLPSLRRVRLDRVAFFSPGAGLVGESLITELDASFLGLQRCPLNLIASACPYLTSITLIYHGPELYHWHELSVALDARRDTLERVRIRTVESWGQNPHPYAPTDRTWATRLHRLTHLDIAMAAIDARSVADGFPAVLPSSLVELVVECPGSVWVDDLLRLATTRDLPALRSVRVDVPHVARSAYVFILPFFLDSAITFTVHQTD